MHNRTLTVAGLLLLLAAGVLADAPTLVNYQGRLTNGSGLPLVGVYSVRFTIYDAATSGTSKWQETQNVTANSDGIFSVVLGSVTPLVDSVFRQPGRYLGIKVGSDPELTPRAQVASVPYALNVADNYVRLAGDTMSGPLWLQNFNFLYRTQLGAGHLMLMGENPSATIDLGTTTHFCSIQLGDPSAKRHVTLDGGGTGSFSMTDEFGVTRTMLSETDAILPDSSVSANEILDEPGIAANDNTSAVALSTTMTDIVTVSITTPASGYIYVVAKGTAYMSGTTGTNYAYAQIDETAGGASGSPYQAVFGGGAMWTTQSVFFPFTVMRVYQKTAGTYTFRLEGVTGSSQAPGAAVDIRQSMIQALYFPTHYGTVNTAAAMGTMLGQ